MKFQWQRRHQTKSLRRIFLRFDVMLFQINSYKTPPKKKLSHMKLITENGHGLVITSELSANELSPIDPNLDA